MYPLNIKTLHAYDSLCAYPAFCIVYNCNVYQYKHRLVKMRAQLASLNHCAGTLFKPRQRQLVLVLLYTVYVMRCVTSKLLCIHYMLFYGKEMLFYGRGDILELVTHRIVKNLLLLASQRSKVEIRNTLQC